MRIFRSIIKPNMRPAIIQIKDCTLIIMIDALITSKLTVKFVSNALIVIGRDAGGHLITHAVCADEVLDIINDSDCGGFTNTILVDPFNNIKVLNIDDSVLLSKLYGKRSIECNNFIASD